MAATSVQRAMALRHHPAGANSNAAVRETLATMMPPEQIAKAQKRAREWLAAFEKRKT